MKRAAVYLRMSQDRLGEGLGVKRQEEDCLALCDRLGWEVAAVLTDNDSSVYSPKKLRPAYQELLAGLRDGHYTAVAAQHPDRLTRLPIELEELITIVEGNDIAIQTVQAGDINLSTPSGRMMARVVGAFARHEVEHKAERQRRKNLELAKAGKPHMGSGRPFGFETDRTTIRKDEAALIREAADRVLSGEPVRSVCRDFNARGIKTSTGVAWSPSTMRRMLCSGRISGQRDHQPHNPNGKRALVGEIVGKAVWEAIIDPMDTARLRALLMDTSRRMNPGHNSRKYLLTGILRCHNCGAGMQGRPREDGVPRYVCAKIPGNNHCGKTYILTQPTDEFVLGMVREVLDSPEFWEALHSKPQGSDEEDLRIVQTTQEKLEELSVDYAEDKISRGEWAAAREVLDRRLREARSRLSRTSPVLVLSEVAADFDQRFAALSLERKRAILGALFVHIEVGAGRRGFNKFDSSRIRPVWRV